MAERVNPTEVNLTFEKTVSINRVAKVTKGAKRFNFRVLVVVGDEQGTVGVGVGKAAEVPDAIRKAVEDAKKNLWRIPRRGTTIPHEVIGHYGAACVLLKPASRGTGVIAGGGRAGRGGSRGHPGRAHQVVGQQQPHQHDPGHPAGSVGTADARGGGPPAGEAGGNTSRAECCGMTFREAVW